MSDHQIAEAVRCDLDRALMAELLQHPDVQAARGAQAVSTRTRRSLLAQALRLSPAVMPEVTDMLSICRQQLGIATQIEAFVYSSPQFNAACTAPEGDRVFILFSSSLLEAFQGDELRFVVGHELGHHVYGHHDVPLGAILGEGGTQDRALVVKAFRWQRFAEISADRAGLLCCGGFSGAARSLFKLSSGLSQSPNEDRIAAYVEQADELYRENAGLESADRIGTTDWMSTHPFSPIRLKAASVFAESEVFTDGAETMESVELKVQSFLDLMDVDYLADQSDAGAAMRHFLTVGAILLVHTDGVVTESEAAAIRSLMPTLNVGRTVDIEGLTGSLDRRIDELLELASPPRCAQVIRDLALIASADGEVSESQLRLLREWASALSVPAHLVEQGLNAPRGLD